MRAEVVALLPPRSCFSCENAVSSPLRNTFCLMYSESIVSETLAAADCPSYTPDDE